MSTSVALTIGTFDGVHAGHRALVRACADHTGLGGRVVVLAFDPHPLTKIRPDAAPGRLSTFAQKRSLLLAAGATDIVQLHPDDALLNASPEEFLRQIAREHAPTVIIEGPDFRFGKGRAGDIHTLQTLGNTLGFTAHTVPEIDVALGDNTLAPARSSLVRWLLSHARVDDAARVLGRPYEVSGVVTKGDQLGRTIGVPTANLSGIEVLLPMNAVYAARATLPDGSAWPCALNIGTRPTVNGVARRVEAHIIGDEASRAVRLLPEYGWNLMLRMHSFLRDELRFASLGALKEQVARDVSRAMGILERKELAWT